MFQNRHRGLPVPVSAVATVSTQMPAPNVRSHVLVPAHASLDVSEAALRLSGITVELQRRISDLDHSVGADNFSIQHLLLLL